MSSTSKKVLLVAVLIIWAGTIIKYKKYLMPASDAPAVPSTAMEEKRSYDQNSPSITNFEINALVEAASAESPAYIEEETDSALLTSDNQALNNFNNTYAPSF